MRKKALSVVFVILAALAALLVGPAPFAFAAPAEMDSLVISVTVNGAAYTDSAARVTLVTG